MEQHTERYKLLVKKLLTGHLSPEERAELNAMERVNKAIRNEWEQASDQYTDKAKETKILHKVLSEIRQEKPGRFRKAVTRYSCVASLALLSVWNFVDYLTDSPR